MLMLLSPAKAMNFDEVPGAPKATAPALKKDFAEIAGVAKQLKKSDIKKLMGISDNLVDLNYERFQALKTSGKAHGAKQAALTFAGDVYRGLDATTMKSEDLEYAQDHLRILSGLYGLLRPLDGIQPYRLEMGSRLKNPRGANLHEFWGPVIAKELDKAVKGHDDPTIVCLASNEYARGVDKKALKSPFIMMNFKEIKDGKTRAIMLYAKQARGMMARWAIQNRIETAEGLKKFKADGYKFSKDLSSDGEWIFTRPQPAPVAAKKKKTA
ncbi:peroxide stress protein YaaA [Hyphococcus sp.]|uniref:peroxide stress protein YaaA n=1 Tax=Hyphococcus sp. TaxID=2038636 RepID=UPI003CCC0074